MKPRHGAVRHTNGIWIADNDSLPYLSEGEMTRPPIKLILSLVGMCNLRCFHCLGASEEMVRASQDPSSASPELIDFLVDRVVPEVRAIRLGGVGYTEQLISRSFDYFMERVQPEAPNLGSFELVTNLSVMTEARADMLARSLTEIQVSIEGIGENFTKLRGMPWSRLVRNAQLLQDAKRRYPGTRMKTTLLVCVMNDMLDDLLRFDVFKDLGVESIVVRELVPRVEHHEKHLLHREPEKTRAFVREFRRRAEEAGIEHLITIADRYDPSDRPPATSGVGKRPIGPAIASRRTEPELRSCTLPFEVLTVVHTGHLGVCCYITDLVGPPEDLSTLNIMDVWNSPSFVAHRKAVNSPDPPAACLSCEVKVGHLSEEEKAQMLTPLKWQEMEAERNYLRAEVRGLRDENSAQRRQIHVLTAQLGTLQQLFRAIQSGRAYKLLRLIGRWQWVERTLAQVAAQTGSTSGDLPGPARC